MAGRWLPAAVATAGVACIVGGIAVWLGASTSETADTGRAPQVQSAVSSTPSPSRPSPTHLRRAGDRHRCRQTQQPFAPTSLSVPGVARPAVVVPATRDVQGTPGVPHLTDTGKHEFAWDAGGIRPGASHGNVLLNAHTWPDGSALGNALLRNLRRGDVLVVGGADGQQSCYRVGDRVVTPFPNTPSDVVARYYNSTGQPQLAIIVCSGQRLGPGVWTRRTLWFASPVR